MDNFLECPICCDIATNAVESVCCNKIFCSQCITEMKESNGVNVECPLCRNKDMKTKESVLARRMIMELTIDCPNKCDSKIIKTKLKDHLKMCPNADEQDQQMKDNCNNNNNENDIDMSDMKQTIEIDTENDTNKNMITPNGTNDNKEESDIEIMDAIKQNYNGKKKKKKK
eukprot:179647_1